MQGPRVGADRLRHAVPRVLPLIAAHRARDLSPARSPACRIPTLTSGRASTGLRAPARGAEASTRAPPRRTSPGEHHRQVIVDEKAPTYAPPQVVKVQPIELAAVGEE
jgi:hypothetical protein